MSQLNTRVPSLIFSGSWKTPSCMRSGSLICTVPSFYNSLNSVLSSRNTIRTWYFCRCLRNLLLGLHLPGTGKTGKYQVPGKPREMYGAFPFGGWQVEQTCFHHVTSERCLAASYRLEGIKGESHILTASTIVQATRSCSRKVLSLGKSGCGEEGEERTGVSGPASLEHLFSPLHHLESLIMVAGQGRNVGLVLTGGNLDLPHDDAMFTLETAFCGVRLTMK